VREEEISKQDAEMAAKVRGLHSVAVQLSTGMFSGLISGALVDHQLDAEEKENARKRAKEEADSEVVVQAFTQGPPTRKKKRRAEAAGEGEEGGAAAAAAAAPAQRRRKRPAAALADGDSGEDDISAAAAADRPGARIDLPPRPKKQRRSNGGAQIPLGRRIAGTDVIKDREIRMRIDGHGEEWYKAKLLPWSDRKIKDEGQPEDGRTYRECLWADALVLNPPSEDEEELSVKLIEANYGTGESHFV